MAESKHTPGEWVVFSHAPWSIWCGEQQIASCRWMNDDGTLGPNCIRHYDQSQANARLIAAAPDLLEALRAIIFLRDQGYPKTGDLDDNVNYRQAERDADKLARAAIAKAVG